MKAPHNTKKKTKRGGLRRNTRPVFIILLLPLLIGLSVATAIVSGLYQRNLADFGSKRLETPNWNQAEATLSDAQPDYVRKFAYYKLKDGQSLESVADYFGVDRQKLAGLNPGIITAGTTIKVPPIERPYQPTSGANGRLNQAIIVEDRGLVRVTHKYRVKQPIVTTMPELNSLLAPYKAMEQTGPKTYRIVRPISLDGDIRLDVTPATVSKIELVSTPQQVTCLCFDESAALFQGVTVTTIDPSTGQPDKTFADGRSFVRMKNGRMDLLDSKFSYLGNALEEVSSSKITGANPFLQEGGVYGVSWRISKGRLGSQLTTGWVENTTFERNHFGTYTFGASGMMWRDNRFAYNDVYGLDPHDDSNNALIEGNVFENNGKHGFIVSKRCNYNIIRNNISTGNKLHGFMLHQDSAYNVMENNISYGNEDNYVIFASNYNTIRNNKSYAPLASHIRVNAQSNNTYITGNEMVGGPRGIFLYDRVANTYIADNTIQGITKNLQTTNAKNTLFARNTIDDLQYDIDDSDSGSMIFGSNTVRSTGTQVPSLTAVYQRFGASQ